MPVFKTVFEIPKMDCPSDENLIKVKLSEHEEILKLDFDIPGRRLNIYHEGNLEGIEKSILNLNLGGRTLSSEEIDFIQKDNEDSQRKFLFIVLTINFAFFLIEIITGIISDWMGLVADSLDMLADAFVYGISLYAVGSTVGRKKRLLR